MARTTLRAQQVVCPELGAEQEAGDRLDEQPPVGVPHEMQIDPVRDGDVSA